MTPYFSQPTTNFGRPNCSKTRRAKSSRAKLALTNFGPNPSRSAADHDATPWPAAASTFHFVRECRSKNLLPPVAPRFPRPFPPTSFFLQLSVVRCKGKV
jgi:hypothetical protein